MNTLNLSNKKSGVILDFLKQCINFCNTLTCNIPVYFATQKISDSKDRIVECIFNPKVSDEKDYTLIRAQSGEGTMITMLLTKEQAYEILQDFEFLTK